MFCIGENKSGDVSGVLTGPGWWGPGGGKEHTAVEDSSNGKLVDLGFGLSLHHQRQVNQMW